MAKPEYPSDKLDQYMLRFPEGMRDDLKEMATHNKRSLNAEIVARLEEYRTFQIEDIKWLKSEMARLRNERDAAERAMTNWATASIDKQLERGFPAGLAQRIKNTANASGRPFMEEVTQALEAAFPPPPPFSLDAFFDEWAMAIINEGDDDKKRILIDHANGVLRENGDKFEAWLEERDDGSLSFAFGSKGSRQFEAEAKKKRDSWGQQ